MSAPKGVTGLVACDNDDSAEEVELGGEVVTAPALLQFVSPKFCTKMGFGSGLILQDPCRRWDRHEISFQPAGNHAAYFPAQGEDGGDYVADEGDCGCVGVFGWRRWYLKLFLLLRVGLEGLFAGCAGGDSAALRVGRRLKMSNGVSGSHCGIS